MTFQAERKPHRLGLKGLLPVIAHLEANPGRTHLLALQGKRGVRKLVVTPKSVTKVVTDLRRLCAKTATPPEALLQTL